MCLELYFDGSTEFVQDFVTCHLFEPQKFSDLVSNYNRVKYVHQICYALKFVLIG